MPSEEISVHDNVILSYTVGCKSREIVFETEFPGDERELTNVTFSGVVAYEFQNDSEARSMIFDFEEDSPLALYDDNVEKFRAHLPYGWPGKWAKSRESARAFFQENGIRAWYLAASVGMHGWILARSMVFERVG